MIDSLQVKDIALIHAAKMDFAEGLTVLTGETGAGKSALLSSFKLLQGERADASAVREGADSLLVEGRFYLEGQDPDGLIVRRSVSAAGRGKVEIDSEIASVKELAAQVGTSIDICGQHEHQKLLDSDYHAELLDAWTEGADAAKEAYLAALKDYREKRKALAELQELQKSSKERLEEAQFVLRQIQEVSPVEQEYEQLEDQLPLAENSETIISATESAHSAISDDEAVLDLLYTAVSELRSASRIDASLQDFEQRIQSAAYELEDVSQQLRKYRDSFDFDEQSLEQMQTRMAQLQRLMRSYGPSMADVFAKKAEVEATIAAAENGGELLAEAETALNKAHTELVAKAQAFTEIRRQAAPLLAQKISEQMKYLEMGSASLEIEVEDLAEEQWSTKGPNHVEFCYRPAEGLSARPLKKIASGGEVSRVMLAAKVVLGDADASETLVFDEVDAGVGGATALALADVLARLAQKRQVIVVTHLAQVAVKAERHFVVEKVGEALAESSIRELSQDERPYEIARMLSGDTTATTLAHAREMLAAANKM